MADEVHSEATLSVVVQAAQLKEITAALQGLTKQVDQINRELKPAAVTAAGAGAAAAAAQGVRRKGQQVEQEMEQQLSFGQRMLVRAVSTAISTPIRAVIGTFQVAGNSLRGFAGAILPALGRVSAMTLSIGGIGLAVTGLLAPLVKFAIGIKLLGISFGWAQEQAQHAIHTAAEARRKFPGLTGEAFEKAQERVAAESATMAGIIGKSVEGIADSVNKRRFDVRMGRGSQQDRELFERLGMNRLDPRTGMLAYMERFTATREKLDAEIKRTPPGARQETLKNMMGGMADDLVEAFGADIAKAMMSWRRSDVRNLRQQMDENTRLGRVPDAERRGINFQIAMKSLMNTFDALRGGIAGDAQPAITDFMRNLRTRIIEVDQNGRSLFKSLRQLGSEMATKAWQTLDELLRKIDIEKVNEWIAAIQGIDSKEAADAIINFGKAFWSAMTYVKNFVEWLGNSWAVKLIIKLNEGGNTAGSTMGGIVDDIRSGRLPGQEAPTRLTPQSSPGGAPAPPSVTPAVGPTSTPPTAPSAAPPSGSNAQSWYDFLRDKMGASHAVAAGVTGSLRGESGTNIDPSAVNPSSGAFGAAQWLGVRKRQIFAWAMRRGLNPESTATQQSFYKWEAENTEKAAWDRIKQARTPEEAAELHTELFERPSRREIASSIGKRRSFARMMFNRNDMINLSPDRMRKIYNPDMSAGSSFGTAMGKSFRQEVGNVPLNIGVANTSSGIAGFSTPLPAGGDMPTE